MATGLYLLQDGTIMVAYGARKIPISPAQYKANGYRPPFEKLKVKPSSAGKAPRQCEIGPQNRQLAHSSSTGVERRLRRRDGTVEADFRSTP